MRNTRTEQMFSASPPTTDIAQQDRHVRSVPTSALQRLITKPQRLLPLLHRRRWQPSLGSLRRNVRRSRSTNRPPKKGLIMSRRTLISLAASVIVGIACLATISTDAFAYRRGVGVGRAGVYHGGVYRGGVYRGAAVRRGVAVGVGAAAVGAAAAGAYYAPPRCGYYPYPPCY